MLTSKILLNVIICISYFIPSTLSFTYNPLSSSQHVNRKNVYRMSMSDRYLNDLQNNIHKKNDMMKKEFNQLLYTAPITNQTEVNPENIYVNINKLQSIFFNKKSTSIMFTSSRILEDLYLYNNNTLSKIPDSTKISCKNVKTFVLCDMNENIDAVLS